MSAGAAADSGCASCDPTIGECENCWGKRIVLERIELQAEVARLRAEASRLEIAQHQWERRADQYARERDEAFNRGAEAMREAIVRYAHDDCGFHAMGRAIKDIPVPEDKP